ncbi:MAG TPA: neutral zinc metallopeptidase [Baekduia sp.]|nr:neutral zinc metallopeptidase [Baekduia sp.]
MRWKRGGSSDSHDVIDQRGSRGGFSRLPGGLGAQAGGGLGLVGVIIFILISVIGGGGVGGSNGGSGSFNVPGFGPDARSTQQGADPIPASLDPDKELREFSAFVFTDVQDAWTQIFADAGSDYRRAKLVLYTAGVNTGGCGSASSAVGPFYCPADERVYIDLSFYAQMREQLGAAGDFAWAYVIAHELGHHVQNLTGTSARVRQLQNQDSDQANALSVRLELQADCYAGVWGQSAFREGQLESGDLEEGLGAAAAVGDDRLQGGGGGTIDQDSFTHGSSDQRVRWFRAGFDSGDPGACDTFSVNEV